MSAQPPSDPSRAPQRRPRPSYGLPGPEQPAGPAPGTPGGAPGWSQEPAPGTPGGAPGSPQDYSAPPQGYSSPSQGYGSANQDYASQYPGYSSPQGYAPQSPDWGGQPAPDWSGGPSGSTVMGAPAGPQPKRKGVWQLIVGIVLLLASFIVAFAMIIGSSLQPVANSLVSAETLEPGASITLQAGEVRMVALASSDVDSGATCTFDIPASQGLSQPLSTPMPEPIAGEPYEAVSQVAAYAQTDLVLDCTGTTHPIALTAPIDTNSLVDNVLAGLAVGTGLGVVGLGLIVWGIIALVRSGSRIRAWRDGRPF